MPAKCPECGNLVPEHDSEDVFPSVANPRGDKSLTAKVTTYSCGCGHKFTTVEYDSEQSPPAEPRD